MSKRGSRMDDTELRSKSEVKNNDGKKEDNSLELPLLNRVGRRRAAGVITELVVTNLNEKEKKEDNNSNKDNSRDGSIINSNFRLVTKRNELNSRNNSVSFTNKHKEFTGEQRRVWVRSHKNDYHKKKHKMRLEDLTDTSSPDQITSYLYQIGTDLINNNLTLNESLPTIQSLFLGSQAPALNYLENLKLKLKDLDEQRRLHDEEKTKGLTRGKKGLQNLRNKVRYEMFFRKGQGVRKSAVLDSIAPNRKHSIISNTDIENARKYQFSDKRQYKYTSLVS